MSSKRRNPVIADLFQRLDLMERRGSGFKKILNAYQFEPEKRGHEFVPTFRSTGSSFFVILPNLNYGITINGVETLALEPRPVEPLSVAENQPLEYMTQQETQQVAQQVTQQVRMLFR